MSPSSTQLALALRWLARITSLLSMGILLLFLTGEDGLIGGSNWAKVRPVEWGALFFFPFGVLLGLGLAWWREALGALVAMASVAAFYGYWVLLTGRIPGGPWFLVFTAPAVFFIASWVAHRPRSNALPV